MAVKRDRSYAPARNWEEKLDALARMYGEEKWKFGAIDAGSLKKLCDEQGEEQAEDERLERAYLGYHKGYMGRQAGRFGKFMKALEFARSEARDNRELAAKLDQLKRDSQSRAKPEPK